MKLLTLDGMSGEELSRLTIRNPLDSAQAVATCQGIFDAVRDEGDAALRRLTRQFDGVEMESLEVSDSEFEEGLASVGEDAIEAMRHASRNIRTFHRNQLTPEAPVEVEPGVRCWRESRAIESVGLYVPSGSAPLPSSLLMLGIPARLAGCREVIVCAPPSAEGRMDPYILAAARLIGIDRLFKLGGAQAIAAMAFGSESVPKVEKIAGPGSHIVQMAKALALQYGVAIDLLAGPSEVLVLSDGEGRPDFIAADLLSQCEHGSDSQAVLVTTSREHALSVLQEVERQLESLPRRSLASLSLQTSFALVVSRLEEGIEFSNRYAPEHLILHVDDPARWVNAIQSAGSVFLGRWSPEVAGDYASGTNHTLPTAGAARAFSGVSVDTFVKKLTFQELTLPGLQSLGPTLENLAGVEGLQGHARAVSLRLAAGDESEAGQALQRWSPLDLVRPEIRSLKAYRSARGEGLSQGVLLDANESPFQEDWQDVSLNRYPDPNQTLLREQIAEHLGLTPQNVVAGVGSDEVLDWLFRVFCRPGVDSVAIAQPTYGMYQVLADTHGVDRIDFGLDARFDLSDRRFLESVSPSTKLLFLCSPNNPTGNLLSPSRIANVCRSWRGVVVVDEAYAEFSEEASWAARVDEFPNLFVVRTLSKAWGRAALRLGYGVARPELIELIMKVKTPYNLGAIPMQLAVEALRDADAMRDRVALLKQGREFLAQQLKRFPRVGPIHPSQANFILFGCQDAGDVCLRLREKGVIVRDRSDLPGLENTVRVSVGTPRENDRFVSALASVFKEWKCHV